MTVRSLREYHILRITDLDTLPADYPILNVITKPEVITLGIISSFLGISRSLGSKGVPEHYKPSCSHRELGSNTVYPIYSNRQLPVADNAKFIHRTLCFSC